MNAITLPEQIDHLAPFRDAENHFHRLLQSENLYLALDYRLRHLEAIAKDIRAEMELAKSVSLGLTLTGCVLASPIALAASAMGLCCYIASVVGDMRYTHKLCPIPFVRKPLMHLVGQVGSSLEGLDDEDDPTAIADITGFLEPMIRNEYEVLFFLGESVAAMLYAIKPEQRWAGYRFILNYARRTAELPTANSFSAAAKRNFQEPTPTPQTAPAQIVGTPQPFTLPATVIQTPWDADEEISPSPATPAAQTWDADDVAEPSLNDLLGYPAVLIYGPPGSGKSTLATWLIYERLKQGHKVEILDPHRKFGQWDGLEVYGDGLDYAACDRRLEFFLNLVRSRYRQRAKNPNFNPQPLTILAEEFTQWDSKCSNAAGFFECSVSDIRKIKCNVVFVSHGRTLTSLGGSKGMAQTRDDAILEAKLEATVDPKTGEAVPTGEVFLFYPGRKTTPVRLQVPQLKTPSFAPSTSTPEPGTNDLAPDLKALWDWAQNQHPPIKARDVQRANIRPLTNYSSEQIRELFLALEKLGKGKTSGLSNNLTYHPTPVE